MPEEFEAGDSGLGEGDSGGQEPSQEDAGASQGSSAQQPSYMTREAFDEAMGGYSTAQQERIDRVAQSFGGMQKLIESLIESQKPKPPPLVPDAKTLEGIDAHGMRELLTNLHGQHDKTVKELREEIQKMNKDWTQKTETQRIHGHFKQQVEETSKNFPMFKKPYGAQLLQQLTIAAIESSDRDYRKVNVPQIGQSINAFIEAEVKERVNAMTRAAQAGADQGKGGKPAPGKAPLKGAPSRPGADPAGGVTLKNFKQHQKDFILRHFPGGND
jgi:hypothetical protein